MNEIYVVIYVNINIAKKIVKNNKFNYEMFGLKSYECPMIDIDEELDYYIFTICEDSVDFGGRIALLILQYADGNAYCTTGYSKNEVKYKYTYIDKKIKIDGWNEKDIYQKNDNLIKEYLELIDYLENYIILSDDEESEENIEHFFEKYNADFDNAREIKEFINQKNIFLLEWTFIEDYMKVLRMAQNRFILEDKPLIFEKEYIIEEIPQQKQSFWGSLFNGNNKMEEHKLSWEEEQFEREANLWGLSEEDKRIAKEERMSPADFIEAEERDDDELVTDEWEDEF